MRAPVHGNQLLNHKKLVKTFGEKKNFETLEIADPSTIDTQIWNANVRELMGGHQKTSAVDKRQ